MLDALIILLSFYGMTFLIKESSILSRPRNWVLLKSTFIAELMLCWFCSGFWSALLVYLLYQWHFGFIFLWGLAGASASFILNAIVDRLTWFKKN